MIKAPQGNANKKYVEQPVIEPGTYPGRIVQVIDMGLQPQRPYQGQDKKPCHEIGFTYELVDTFVVDEAGKEIEDKPRWMSEVIPLHPLIAEKAKSTQRYKALDPENQFDGDFSQIADIPCNVLIVHNKKGDKVYENVASISAMRPKDAAKCPELKNPVVVFSLDTPDINVFNKLPKWIQSKIQSNLNYKGSKLEKLLPKEDIKEVEQENEPLMDKNNPY